MTGEDAAFHKRLVQAIADPGQFTPRGDDHGEPITSWGARAVMILLSDLRVECNAEATDPIGGWHFCALRPFHDGDHEDDVYEWATDIGRTSASGGDS